MSLCFASASLGILVEVGLSISAPPARFGLETESLHSGSSLKISARFAGRILGRFRAICILFFLTIKVVAFLFVEES